MSFTHPPILFLLVLPVLLLFWVWRKNRGRIVLPLDHSIRKPAQKLNMALNAAESLPALLLAAVILILAGPEQLGAPKSKRALTNIQFCVDISGSMTAKFGDGTRYDASMKAINDFLDFRKGDAFGLSFFGNSVLHWTPLTSDASALRCAAPFMKPENVPPWFGGTEIGKALMACREVLTSREKGNRMIILITDGWSYDLGNGADEEIAQTLKKDNIAVYAIHIDESEIPEPIVNITSRTGGQVFSPDDPARLQTIFKQIDAMQKTELEKVGAETMDHYFPFCIAALSLFALSMLSSFGLRATPW